MESSNLEPYQFTLAFQVILRGLEPLPASAATGIAAVPLGIIAFPALGSIGLFTTVVLTLMLVAGLGIIFYFEIRGVGR